MPGGGRQPGAGRPKGMKNKSTIETEAFRAYLRQKISEAAEELIEAMVTKAKGCAIIDKKDDTGERIYDLPPDPQAFKVLMDYSHGKKNDVKVEGPGENGEFVIKWLQN